MAQRTLGSLTLTAGARVYEQAGSAMVELNTGDIAHLTVPANKIAAYHANSSNMVDYVVLDAVTGDAYRYGMMVSVTTKTTDEDGEDSKDVSWKLTRGSNTVTFGQQYTYNGKSGDLVGVVVGVDSSGAASIRSVTALTAVKNVSPAQFFESQGLTYVSVSGKTYQVADGVECYRSLSSSRYSADNWFQQSTGAERLAACKAFSDNLTLYVDPVGNKVRIIVAN
jgi:hypothetical protein